MKVVFLDRDETLNEDPGYLRDASKVRLLPNVAAGLRRLGEAGYEFIILTNQSGVGRRLIAPEELEAVNRRLFELLAAENVRVRDLFFCPHVDADNCNCRKPAPGLLWQALTRYPQTVLSRSWILGDRYRDLAPGETPRPPDQRTIDTEPFLRGILVGGRENGDPPPKNLVYRARDLLDAAGFIQEKDEEAANRTSD